MEPWIIALVAFFATVTALFLIWLWMIAPSRRNRKNMAPFMRPYAHRGLWSEGKPENSLAAFRAAVDAGFGIELDVQLSSDGTVMVFHDYTLERVCGREGLLTDLSAAELVNIPLMGTEQTIPTLAQVLELVAGRVPLLIELKGETGDTSVVGATLAALEGYQGAWCMESFNPLLMRAVKKQAPHVVRGLLSTDLCKEKKRGGRFLNFLLSALLVTFLCRPAFHAWDGRYPKRRALRVGLNWFKAGSLVFTISTQKDYDDFMARGIYPIFERFVPEKK